MDREIKFRGQTTNTKKWIYGFYIEEEWKRDKPSINRHYIMETKSRPNKFSIIPESVGQYVGLKDKNGKEIYEGDIVQHEAWNYPFEIIFNDEKVRFVCKLKTGLAQYIDCEKLVVIGNIHTNPELLEAMAKKIICWWSGGITSAVACKVAIDLFGIENCTIVMIDTYNEHPDTYRFKDDCAKWYGKEIEVITDVGKQYENIQDVWRKHKSLNVASGAICSTQLKRRVREKWQENVEFDHQVFGFEFNKKEFNRAKSLTMNHVKAKGIYPLLMLGYDKDKCLEIVREAGIEIPIMYQMGFRNNNCFSTGCVQGGIGYWQKMKRDFPDKFEAMANMEHELTELKGEPVTMLKDQTKEAKQKVEETGLKWMQFIFLKKHPNYPDVLCIDDKPEMEVKPLFECSGFCGTNDLNEITETQGQINFQFD